eukprot:599752-Amphidinium_carterae.1
MQKLSSLSICDGFGCVCVRVEVGIQWPAPTRMHVPPESSTWKFGRQLDTPTKIVCRGEGTKH